VAEAQARALPALSTARAASVAYLVAAAAVGAAVGGLARPALAVAALQATATAAAEGGGEQQLHLGQKVHGAQEGSSFPRRRGKQHHLLAPSVNIPTSRNWLLMLMRTHVSMAVQRAWRALVARVHHYLILPLRSPQQVAALLRGKGLGDQAIVVLVAALPVLELRGAIPVGVWLGLPLAKVLGLAVVGNMLPVAPLLLALRWGAVRRLLKPVRTTAL
jgi:hypothetical protein